jgi:hypothetical protein
MDINYFIFLKKQYKQILFDLEQTMIVIDEYYLSSPITNEITDNIINPCKDIHENLLDKIQMCEKDIQDLCQHEFIVDLIDIDPDKSISIKYCQLCLVYK